MLIAGEEPDLGSMDVAPEPGLTRWNCGSNLHARRRLYCPPSTLFLRFRLLPYRANHDSSGFICGLFDDLKLIAVIYLQETRHYTARSTLHAAAPTSSTDDTTSSYGRTFFCAAVCSNSRSQRFNNSKLYTASSEAAERLVVDDFLILAWMPPVEESQVGASKIYGVQGEVKGEEEALEAKVVMEVKPFT
ncbi:hypothetical protein OIU74_024889 [Salix koriyanagi]|uniref:Uncharacterized protein n=1 Tax=Salix koriyanagi TaxID=2511006 RepID=A0A9Q0W8D7_9ROSI|nr:hypothetical protein OIU74_024889 [Salix koriyanagi]